MTQLKVLFFGIVITVATSQSIPAYAACNFPADAKMSRLIHYSQQSLNCMRAGIDPPRRFIQETYMNTGIGSTLNYGIMPKVVTPPGHPVDGNGSKLALAYRDLYCTQTKPGGLSSDGATTICQTGTGVAGSLIPLLRMPALGIDLAMIECLAGVSGALGGGGGNIGDAFSASASVNQCGPGCTTGSVGICSIGISSGCVCPLGPEGGQIASAVASGADAQIRYDGETFVSMDTPNFNINVQDNLETLQGSTYYLPTSGIATVQLPPSPQFPNGRIVELNLLENDHIVIDQDTGRLFAGGPNGNQNIFDTDGLPGIELPEGTQITLTANSVNGVAGNVVVPESVLTGSLGGVDVLEDAGELINTNTAQAAYVPAGNELGQTVLEQIEAPRTTEPVGLVAQYAQELLDINTSPESSAGAYAPSPVESEADIINNGFNQEMAIAPKPTVQVPD